MHLSLATLTAACWFTLLAPHPGGHSSSRRELAQRANAPYCSRCTSASHVTLPPPFSPGKTNDERAEGFAMWKGVGPWGPQRPAALHYAGNFGPLPPRRDWEEDSLTMDSLMRAPSHGGGLNLHVPSTFRGYDKRTCQPLWRYPDASPTCDRDARDGPPAHAGG